MGDTSEKKNDKPTIGFMISQLFHDEFDPSNQSSLLKHIQCSEWVLSRYLIKETAGPSWVEDIGALSELPAIMDGKPIELTATEQTTITSIKAGLEAAQRIHKQLKQLTDALNQKLNDAIQTKSPDIWQTLTDWIDKQTTTFLNHNTLEYEPFQQPMNAWVMDVNRSLHANLEAQVKDYLQAMAYHHIIQPKLSLAPEWKTTISEQPIQNNGTIQQLELAIKTEITTITKPFDAPFITQFSNELYTRCYRRLLSPKETPPTRTTINEITADLNSPPKKPSWPIPIQNQFNQEYMAFLNQIYQFKPDVRKYSQYRFKSLVELSKDSTLNESEKKFIHNTYMAIYKTTRRYEHLIDALTQKNEALIVTSSLHLTKAICQNIELVCHAFAPFVKTYIQYMTLNGIHNTTALRKEHVGDFTKANATLQRLNKMIQLSQLLNHYFQHHPKAPTPDGHDSTMASHMSDPGRALQTSISPWEDHPWDDELALWVQNLGLTRPTIGEKRFPKTLPPFKPPSTTSFIKTSPKPPPSSPLQNIA